MNYLALKNMMEVITKTYKCPECEGLVKESGIEIMGTAGTTINIDAYCEKCDRHSIMKAEVASAGINMINKEMLQKIKNNLIKNNIKKNKQTNKILLKDKDVINLNNKLKSDNINISDLF